MTAAFFVSERPTSKHSVEIKSPIRINGEIKYVSVWVRMQLTTAFDVVEFMKVKPRPGETLLNTQDVESLH